MKSFYLPPQKWQPPFTLDASETHHLLHVVRARAGDHIRLFDGCGREGIFSLVQKGKDTVQFELLSEQVFSPLPAPAVLAIGWGKNLRRTWLLEKAVEFEAAEIWFWQAERSQGKMPEKAPDNWQAQMIAGAKQCGNLWLPAIHLLPGGLSDVIRRSASAGQAYFLWEEQKGEPLLSLGDLRAPTTTIYIIGPEGGFTPGEADQLVQAAIPPRSFGRQVLRWETAALLCLGLHWWANQPQEKKA